MFALYISGVFALINAYGAVQYVQLFLSKKEFKAFFFVAIVTAAGMVFVSVVGLTYLGKDDCWEMNCFILKF